MLWHCFCLRDCLVSIPISGSIPEAFHRPYVMYHCFPLPPVLQLRALLLVTPHLLSLFSQTFPVSLVRSSLLDKEQRYCPGQLPQGKAHLFPQGGERLCTWPPWSAARIPGNLSSPAAPRRCCACAGGSSASGECTPGPPGLSSGSSPRA